MGLCLPGSCVTENSDVSFVGLKGTFGGDEKIIFIY